MARNIYCDGADIPIVNWRSTDIPEAETHHADIDCFEFDLFKEFKGRALKLGTHGLLDIKHPPGDHSAV